MIHDIYLEIKNYLVQSGIEAEIRFRHLDAQTTPLISVILTGGGFENNITYGMNKITFLFFIRESSSELGSVSLPLFKLISKFPVIENAAFIIQGVKLLGDLAYIPQQNEDYISTLSVALKFQEKA